jgi:hypothetical protein
MLASDGSLSRAAVFEASDARLARTALDALHAAEPTPLPKEAACLVGVPIIGTFTNPG